MGETVTMLDLQPTLASTHITLRPLAAQDFDALFAAASDPLVWAQHPDPGRGTREGFPPFFGGALKSKGCLVASVETVGFRWLDPCTRLSADRRATANGKIWTS
jgi:RimJ/RimL family protein N-acetyltransferase